MLMMSCLISIVYSLYKKWKNLLGINYYKLYWYKEHDKIGNGMSNSVQKLKKKTKIVPATFTVINIMVLIIDDNPGHVAHARMKKDIFG